MRAVGIHRQVMGVGVGHRRFPLAAPRRVPGGTGKPEMGLVPARLTQNGEPPTKPAAPWSKLSALKSSTPTPLPPAPINGLV